MRPAALSAASGCELLLDERMTTWADVLLSLHMPVPACSNAEHHTAVEMLASASAFASR